MYIGNFIGIFLALLCAVLMSSCASVAENSAAKSFSDAALEKIGLTKISTVQMQAQQDAKKSAQVIHLSLQAGSNLNGDKQNSPLSVVVKLYKLRSSLAFGQLGLDAAQAEDLEKEALRQDLIEVRDITLVPGQHLQIDELVPPDASTLGIVALFRKPAIKRWKFAFAADSAAKTGITIGLHACALSVTRGKPLATEPWTDPQFIAATRCGE